MNPSIGLSLLPQCSLLRTAHEDVWANKWQTLTPLRLRRKTPTQKIIESLKIISLSAISFVASKSNRFLGINHNFHLLILELRQRMLFLLLRTVRVFGTTSISCALFLRCLETNKVLPDCYRWKHSYIKEYATINMNIYLA